MENHPHYISNKRIPRVPPEKLVIDGEAQFGTFNTQLPQINLLDLNCASRLKNRLHLSEWQACEISFRQLTLVTAVYAAGPVGFSIMVVFDKIQKKVTHHWLEISSRKNVKIAQNLINEDSVHQTKNCKFILRNDFQNGKAGLAAKFTGRKSGTIEIDIYLSDSSAPSCVSIPLGKNLPLYSQKNLFSVQGSICINGEIYYCDKTATAIIDDHKGYYPKTSHYDWLTAMDKINIGGIMHTFGFNLTRNQSMQEDDYNENLLWIDKQAYPLPPVSFIKHGNNWQIKDKYGKVDLIFSIHDTYVIRKNIFGLFVIRYYLPFGTVSGKLIDTENKEYVLEKMSAIGEDKWVKIPFGKTA